MSPSELSTLRDYIAELDFLGQKLGEKQSEIERELERLRLVQKALGVVLEAHPELSFDYN